MLIGLQSKYKLGSSRVPSQTYYKTSDPRVLSPSIVKSAVKEILFLAQKELDRTIRELAVLDIGSGYGEYSFEIEKYVKKVVGVEPFLPVYKKAISKKKKIHSKVSFYNLPVEEFKSRQMFDLVVSLTTIEHMPEANESFLHIFELMRKGAVIYLTAPNKLWPFEHHYRLLFLSWLPSGLADYYVRITGRGKSYRDSAYSKTYFGMRKFFDQFQCDYKFILPQDANASYLGCGTEKGVYRIIKSLGIYLISKFPFFWIFSKGFIMLIRKR